MSKDMEIRTILEGKMSAAESRELLNGIDSKDMEHFLTNDENKSVFEAYKKTHPSGKGRVKRLPEARIDDMWINILERSLDKKKQTKHDKGKIHRWMTGILKQSWISHPIASAALACSLVLVVTFSVLNMDKKDPIGNYLGNKGGILAEAALEYAVVGEQGKLDRPDRALTESDTLAFRLDVKQSGYYSIGVCHGKTCDWVISNRELDKGIHDLKDAYILTGNRGENTIILVSSEKPVRLGDHERYLLEKSGSDEPVRVTIEYSRVSVSFQKINVKKK